MEHFFSGFKYFVLKDISKSKLLYCDVCFFKNKTNKTKQKTNKQTKKRGIQSYNNCFVACLSLKNQIKKRKIILIDSNYVSIIS